MFHEERLQNIGIRVRLHSKEELTYADIEINQAGEVNLNEVLALVKEAFHLDPHLLFFYLNHSRATYEYIDQEAPLNVHFTALISESTFLSRQTTSPSNSRTASPTKFWPTPTSTRRTPAPSAAASGSSRRPSCRSSSGATSTARAASTKKY